MSTASLHKYVLRPVGKEAAPILTEIHAEAFANYWNPNDFNDFFAISGTTGLLAEAEGATNSFPAGMAVLRVIGDQADIITIAVRPRHRRQGLARALMQHAMDLAIKSGASTMYLDVEEGNIPAIYLYEALGFRQLSRRKLYYRQKDGTYTDALVMTRKLA